MTDTIESLRAELAAEREAHGVDIVAYALMRDAHDMLRGALTDIQAERDAALASAAAMREALEKIADNDKNREAFVMRGAFAMRDMVQIAKAALRDPAGADLLARIADLRLANEQLGAAGKDLYGKCDGLRKLCGEASERMLYAWRVLLRDQWLEVDSEPYRALAKRLKEASR